MKSSLRSKLSALVQRRRQVERRSGKRVVPTHRTLGLLRAAGEDDWAAGLVYNLSHSGAALRSERLYPAGACVRLLLVNAAHTFSVALALTVVRSAPDASGAYFVAGRFDRPLCHEEMVPLVV